MPNFLRDILPLIISGGSAIAGNVLGARAAGRASEAQTDAVARAAELERESARDALGLQREMYNRGIATAYPFLTLGSQALGPLGRGMGFPVPEGGYAIPSLSSLQIAPGQFGGAGGTATGEGTPGGNLSNALLSADANLHPPSTLGTVAGRAGAGAGLGALVGGLAAGAIPGAGAGAILGLPAGPIGAGIGAAIGGLTGLIGRGRKEADKIVPYQNALTSEIKRIENDLDARAAAGTLTDAEWQNAIAQVTQLRDQFYGLTQDFGRAGPGARQTIGSWVDPLLSQWQGRQARPIGARMRGGEVHSGDYIVGEKGPEILRMTPGSTGHVYPHSTLRKLQHRQAGGPVAGLPAFNAHDPQPYFQALRRAVMNDPALQAQYAESFRLGNEAGPQFAGAPTPGVFNPETWMPAGMQPNGGIRQPDLNTLYFSRRYQPLPGGTATGTPSGDIQQPDLNTILDYAGPPQTTLASVPGGPGGGTNPYPSMAAPFSPYEGEFLQPWQEQFSFRGEDVFNDPGYQFRLNEGMKALERSASARGTLGSGRTLKEMTRYGQDYASGEYGTAYNRALNEFRQRHDIFRQNQADRYNRLSAVAGGGQVAAGQLGSSAQVFGGQGSDVLFGSGGRQADLALQGGNARAAGYAASPWPGVFGAGQNIGELLTLRDIYRGGG